MAVFSSPGDIGNEKLRSSLTSQRVALPGNAFRGNGTAASAAAGVGDFDPLAYDHRGCDGGGGADDCGDRSGNRASPHRSYHHIKESFLTSCVEQFKFFIVQVK